MLLAALALPLLCSRASAPHARLVALGRADRALRAARGRGAVAPARRGDGPGRAGGDRRLAARVALRTRCCSPRWPRWRGTRAAPATRAGSCRSRRSSGILVLGRAARQRSWRAAWTELLPRRAARRRGSAARAVRLLADGVAITVAATLATAPLLAHHFGSVPLAGLPANLLALPAVAPAMWLGMVKAALGQLRAWAARAAEALGAARGGGGALPRLAGRALRRSARAGSWRCGLRSPAAVRGGLRGARGGRYGRSACRPAAAAAGGRHEARRRAGGACPRPATARAAGSRWPCSWPARTAAGARAARAAGAPHGALPRRGPGRRHADPAPRRHRGALRRRPAGGGRGAAAAAGRRAAARAGGGHARLARPPRRAAGRARTASRWACSSTAATAPRSRLPRRSSARRRPATSGVCRRSPRSRSALAGGRPA